MTKKKIKKVEIPLTPLKILKKEKVEVSLKKLKLLREGLSVLGDTSN